MKTLATIVLFLTVTLPVLSQTKKQTSEPASKPAFEAQIKSVEAKPAQQVTVEKINGDKITGLFVRGDAESVTINISGTELRVSVPEIYNLRFKEMTETYTPVLKRNPFDNAEVSALLKQADEFYAAGNYAEAGQALRSVLEKEPANADAFFLTGMIALREGDASRAVSALKTAVFWNAKHQKAHLELAKIFLERNDCVQAKQHINAASSPTISSNREALLLLVRAMKQCK